MVRPLRLEYAGALYHVMARGNRREPLFLDGMDFSRFLECVERTCDRFNWLVHAYCLMTNHYHLLVETPDGNLSRGMRQLNGVYTQRFNRRHGKVGHLFQGRYRAILVQKEAYLLELGRYVVLNPVRAGMAQSPREWPWCSYPAVTGACPAPEWLETDWLLTQFGRTRTEAVSAYERFVAAGVGAASPLDEVRHQLFLGDDAFISLFEDAKAGEELADVARTQRRPMARPLPDYAEYSTDRDEAMAKAYRSGAYTMKQIAAHFGVHYMTVSRAVRKWERR